MIDRLWERSRMRKFFFKHNNIQKNNNNNMQHIIINEQQIVLFYYIYYSLGTLNTRVSTYNTVIIIMLLRK